MDRTRRGHGLAFARRDKNRFGSDRERETRRLQHEQLLAKIAAKKRQEEAKKSFTVEVAPSLPAEERHEYYQKILKELILDSESLEDLKRRGFTEEQIEKCGFKSIKRNQALKRKYPKNLPGISWNQKMLFVGGAGTIIPVRNADGYIVALQLRFHKLLDDSGRYRWVSTPQTAVLQTKEFGELPLAIYIPSSLKTFKIVFPEGTGHKPYLAAERLGAVAIGAAGGLHGSSPETLLDALAKIKSALKEVVTNFSSVKDYQGNWLKTQLHKSLELGLASETDSKKDTEEIRDTKLQEIDLADDNSQLKHKLCDELDNVAFEDKSLAQALDDVKANGFSLDLEIVPDAGFALNSHVKRNLKNLAEILENVVKDGEGYNPIIVAEWNQICKNCGDIDELPELGVIRHLQLESFYNKYQTAFEDPQGYEKWAKDRITLTADIVQYERWLTIPKDIEKQCDILLIRKGLGGGKTQGLINFLLTQAAITLLIGYRNTLLNNTIKRSNEEGLSAAHIKAAKEFEQVIKGFNSKIRINLTGEDSLTKLWAGCADSFHKFNALIGHVGKYFTALDEIVSVLNHLKSGGTLKKRQQSAIAWVTETIENSAFSIMMDANLSDKEVEFIRKLFPEKRILVLDSIHEVSPRTFHFVETKSKKDYSRGSNHLPEHLVQIARQHKRVLWLSDSQRSCETANELFVKEGHKHFRLDRKTSSDELAKLFQEDPQNFIVTEQLDSASLSPSGESGLSIALFGYFDAVLFDIRGTVGVNTLTQMSARLRDTKVPIFVACPEFVNFTENICPHGIHKLNQVLLDKILWSIAQGTKVEPGLSETEFAKLALYEFAENALNDPWFIQSLQDSKQLVYEHQNLKLTLKTALLQQGNIIHDLIVEINAQTEGEFKETKEVIGMRHATKVHGSISIDIDTAQILSQTDQSYDVQCQVEKAFLMHRLPGIEHTTSWSPEFIYQISVKNPHFLEGRWRLHQLQDEELAKAEFINNNKHSFEEGFNPMEVWSNKSTKLEALREFGIKELIDGQTFTASSTQAFVDRYYKEQSWFNLIEISRAKQTRNENGKLANTKYVKVMADRFLGFFGLEAKSKKGKYENSYAIAVPEDFQDFIQDIDNCYKVRAENAISKAEKISLTELAQTEEEQRKQDIQGDIEHPAVLEQPIIYQETVSNNANSIYGGELPVNYIEEERQVTPLELNCNNNNNQSTVCRKAARAVHAQRADNTWFTPENQNWLAEGLCDCETPQDVNAIRGFAPVAALKSAARLLDENARAKVRELTKIANQNRNLGFGVS
ncbi:hypothetical protein [Mastigocoleus testarum]|uniref:Replication origin-binding protein domain-containing protein n=1 Tax=Mastigocoleus testarum BC008 TaxID=371196 RepID=A0A0V7ZGF6_9CYAN|nr:hypothetical protein [Mastigocoleus testarum]KST63537.1 hypothetical protein BC008_13820 [Mastigocoleus testarum BC008]